MRAPRVAVLDMAGTTVRDPGVVEQATREAVEHVAGRLPEDFQSTFFAARGGSKLTMLEALLPDPNSAPAAHSFLEQALLRHVNAGALPPLPSARAAIEQLKADGWLVALATGFAPRVRTALLASLGWEGLVDLALSPSDAGRGRPFPDLVLTALLQLGAQDVRDVAVVGDTVNDLLAGTRAGAGIVAGVLTGAHDAQQLGNAPHTHLVPDVKAFADVAIAG